MIGSVNACHALSLLHLSICQWLWSIQSFKLVTQHYQGNICAPVPEIQMTTGSLSHFHSQRPHFRLFLSVSTSSTPLSPSSSPVSHKTQSLLFSLQQRERNLETQWRQCCFTIEFPYHMIILLLLIQLNLISVFNGIKQSFIWIPFPANWPVESCALAGSSVEVDREGC